MRQLMLFLKTMQEILEREKGIAKAHNDNHLMAVFAVEIYTLQ